MSEVAERILDIRREWADRLLLLGHHYQRSTVLQHVDQKGDSLELARCAARGKAERVVFCGVHFMAESADILTAQGQTVYMPDTSAGCPMANMATGDSMRAAWDRIGGAASDWLPVVYVNSTAEIKACCGAWGGSACTSGNASAVIRWVLGQGKRVFFLPDEHLCINTGHDLGLADDDMAVYDPSQPGGGLDDATVASVKILAWKGFCLVHTAFSAEQVHAVRARMPEARIIVHPEAPKEVVRASDAHGSTSEIIRYVESVPDGSTVVIGTEQNLVERLAAEQAGRITVKALAPSLCANMAKTSEAALLGLLTDWPARNEIHVPEPIAYDARHCLETMLSLG